MPSEFSEHEDRVCSFHYRTMVFKVFKDTEVSEKFARSLQGQKYFHIPSNTRLYQPFHWWCKTLMDKTPGAFAMNKGNGSKLSQFSL